MKSLPCIDFANPSSHAHAFSLIELLVVVAIMSFLLTIATVSIPGLKGSQEVSKAAYSLNDILQQGRSYAMAYNTYVYVGITEVDQSQPSTVTPQATGYGRIAVALLASKDGTNPLTSTGALTATNASPLIKLTLFEGAHLADFTGLTASTGAMSQRQSNPTSIAISGTSAPLFTWPLSATNKQYGFTQVIQFDPMGTATLQSATNLTSSLQWLEVALQSCRGNLKPSAPGDLSTGNLAAIQIDGVTGATRVYRP